MGERDTEDQRGAEYRSVVAARPLKNEPSTGAESRPSCSAAIVEEFGNISCVRLSACARRVVQLSTLAQEGILAARFFLFTSWSDLNHVLYRR